MGQRVKRYNEEIGWSTHGINHWTLLYQVTLYSAWHPCL